MAIEAAGSRRNTYTEQDKAKEQRMHEMTRESIKQAIKEGRVDELPAGYRKDPHYADLFPPEEIDIFTSGNKGRDTQSYDDMDTERDGMGTGSFEAEG